MNVARCTIDVSVVERFWDIAGFSLVVRSFLGRSSASRRPSQRLIFRGECPSENSREFRPRRVVDGVSRLLYGEIN